MAKKIKISLPSQFTEFAKKFRNAAEADLAAQAAENALKARLAEGLPETQNSVVLVYGLTQHLKGENEQHVKTFFTERTYLAYDPTGIKPNGIPKPIPFGKPALENYAIPASKLAMPNRDKS